MSQRWVMNDENDERVYERPIEQGSSGGYATEVNKAVLENVPKPSRTMAPFLWYGGKGSLAKWIIKHFPREGVRTYVEPYAGAASVFFHLPRPYPVEVLNDLDRRIINLFRVLQDREKFESLAHRLIWTPYAWDEFKKALKILHEWEEHDPINRAWAFFVAQNQGFGGTAKTEGHWGRALTVISRGMAQTTNTWRGRLKSLSWWHTRLANVQIDSRDALEVLKHWDAPDTLFYVDPPYILETRKSRRVYNHEQPLEHHQALIEALLNIKGRAVLSGYDHPSYEPLEKAGWRRYERKTSVHAVAKTRVSGILGTGAAKSRVKRVEVLWLNFEMEVSNG